MTLVAAVALDDGRVWIGAERQAGDDPYLTLAGPKVFTLETPAGDQFVIGFAGSPRVAQTILAVTPPDRGDGSLHWWLTEYADRILERCRDLSLLVERGNGDGSMLAGYTHALVGVDGRVFKFGQSLSWEEPARGWEAIGCAFETFHGAYEVLRQSHDRVAAARLAWPVCQRFHHVGDLVDEITVSPPTGVHPGRVAGSS